MTNRGFNRSLFPQPDPDCLEAKSQTRRGKRRKHLPPLACIGYQPEGGPLPFSVPQPRAWGPYAENLECLVSSTPSSEWRKHIGSNQTRMAVAVQPPPQPLRHAILLGVMKGGTQALMSYLYQHPRVSRVDKRKPLEDHFFNQWLVQTPHGIPQALNQHNYTRYLQHRHSNDLWLNGDYKQPPQQTKRRRTRSNQRNMVVIDDTPYYFAGGQRIAKAITCIAPWAKLLVILRDPMARIDSQYRYMNQGRKHLDTPMVGWDVWIDHDLQLLYETGVLRKNLSDAEYDAYAGSAEEAQAWMRYVLRQDGSMMIVGKSLYAIQLDLYWQAMDNANKPRRDLMVIQSERLRNNIQGVYNRILQHLELPPHTLKHADAKHQTLTDAAPMPDTVRQKLEEIFEPYNRRLCKMLGWQNVWENTR